MSRHRLIKAALWILVFVLVATATVLTVIVVTAVALVIRDFWNMI